MRTQIRCSETSVRRAACSVATESVGCGPTEAWVGRIVVATLSGDLDLLTAPKAAKAIQAAAWKEPTALIVDLSRVEFLGVAGINLLIAAHRAAAPITRFGVVADGPTTGRPLELTGVATILAVYRTLDDALADFA